MSASRRGFPAIFNIVLIACLCFSVMSCNKGDAVVKAEKEDEKSHKKENRRSRTR